MSLDHDWMRTTLESLYEASDIDQVKRALSDAAERALLREQINLNALAGGRLGRIPDGQYGDNLLQGLLALRMKFDRATAMDKLEVNLAMRSRWNG